MAYVRDVRVQPACDLHLADGHIQRLRLSNVVEVSPAKRQVIDLGNLDWHVRDRLNLTVDVEPAAKMRAGSDVRAVHNLLYWPVR